MNTTDQFCMDHAFEAFTHCYSGDVKKAVDILLPMTTKNEVDLTRNIDRYLSRSTCSSNQTRLRLVK
ncbi:hypothetical protein ACI2KR_08645 [Pseudomonas luteola]